jgi:hypothetical protein
MNSAYFQTRFVPAEVFDGWPDEFVIISGYATTGEVWTREQSEDADARLAGVLGQLGVWHRRIVGYSPITDHAEPSWAAAVSLDTGCDIGQAFQQDAVYHVIGDQLRVVRCASEKQSALVGSFRDRLDRRIAPHP